MGKRYSVTNISNKTKRKYESKKIGHFNSQIDDERRRYMTNGRFFIGLASNRIS